MRKLAALIFAATLSLQAAAAGPAWEPLDAAARPHAAVSPSVDKHADSDDALISVVDGYIHITTYKPTTVKVFTILGQLIGSETVQPGSYRMRIATKGIYIVKTDASTRRVIL